MPELAYPDDLTDGTVRLRPWTPHDTGVAVGLVILRLARRAIGLVTEWGLAAFDRIEAWVEPANEASRRVLTVNGFQQEGLLRSFLVLGSRRADVLVHSRVGG